MSRNFEPGEIVLIQAEHGFWATRRVIRYTSEGNYLLSEGHYATAYNPEHIHKCPMSIVKSLPAPNPPKKAEE